MREQSNSASGQGWTAKFRRAWSDPVGSKLIADGIKVLWILLVVPVAIAAWRLGPRMFLAITLPGWWSVVHDRRQIAIWLILFAVLALVVVWRIGRMRGYKVGHVAGARAVLVATEKTEPTEVLAVDERCGLFWRVKFPLREIQAVDVDGASPGYLRSIVDGPFHLKRECHERMQLVAYDGGDDFREKTPCLRAPRRRLR